MSESEIRNRMSLDEVIEALEDPCDVYTGPKEQDVFYKEVSEDALFYLRQLDQKRIPTIGKKFHITIDGCCPECGFAVNSKMGFCPTCGKEIFGKGKPYEPCDCPLTWDELKEMIGKPIWIMEGGIGYWYIIQQFDKNGFAEYMLTTPFCQWWKDDFGQDEDSSEWQAYRNEVES